MRLFSLRQFVRLPPIARRLVLIGIDLLLLPLSVWLGFWLRIADTFDPSIQVVELWVLPAALLIGLPIYAFTGQYKGLTRYVGSPALYRLAGRNGLLVLLLASVGVLMRLPMPPPSSWILLWLLLIAFTGASRFVLRDLLLSLRSLEHKQMVRVAIYGAGEAGAQLAAALRLAGNHQIVTFLDDSPVLWRRTINGTPIHPPQVLSEIQDQLDQVLLAIPQYHVANAAASSLNCNARRFRCCRSPLLMTLPGRARIDSLRPVSIEDLLAEIVLPVAELLGPCVRDEVVASPVPVVRSARNFVARSLS